MNVSPADKEMLAHQDSRANSPDPHTPTSTTAIDPEHLAARRRTFHSRVLIGGLVVTVVLGLALGVGLGLTVGRYGRG